LRITNCRFLTFARSGSEYPRGCLPEIAFLGRSNVGKSSLINALVGRKGMARTSGTPGLTQQAHFYSINESVLFVDLPGYGYARAPAGVRDALAGIIESYLSAGRPLALAVLILDSRHQPAEMDLGMNAWLGERGLPIQIVGNKIDKLSRGERHESLSRLRRIMRREDIIPFSSANGEGKRELWQAIDHQIALLRSRALDARTGGPGK